MDPSINDIQPFCHGNSVERMANIFSLVNVAT